MTRTFQVHSRLLSCIGIIVALIGLAACSSPAPTPKQDSSKNVTIDIVIQNSSFSPNSIIVEAGTNVVINFTNKDTGIVHNFVLYRPGETAPSASFIGKQVTGPGTAVYKFKAPAARPAGTYFFACDTHYMAEQGTFEATFADP